MNFLRSHFDVKLKSKKHRIYIFGYTISIIKLIIYIKIFIKKEQTARSNHDSGKAEHVQGPNKSVSTL